MMNEGEGGGGSGCGINSVMPDHASIVKEKTLAVVAALNAARKDGEVYSFSIGYDEKRGGSFLETLSVTTDVLKRQS